MAVQIRAMNVTDIQAIQAVARKTWAHTYQGVIPDAVQAAFLGRAYSKESLEQRMEKGVFLVAVQEGKIVGFANFFRYSATSGDVELAAIYVLPEAQGQGIGTSLLMAGIREMGKVSRVIVKVNRDNPAARRFYEAKGFRFAKDLVEEFFGHQQHLIEMVLPVPSKCEQT